MNTGVTIAGRPSLGAWVSYGLGTDNQNMPLEFQLGYRWTTQYRTFPPGVPEHIRVMNEYEYRIAAKEKIVVPAGTFDCFRIEGRGRAVYARGSAELSDVRWFAPEKVRRFVARDFVRKSSPGNPIASTVERQELVSFKQS